MPADRAGVVAPLPWMTKPTTGSATCAPCGTDWVLVNQRSPAVRIESPVDVVMIFVCEPEPRRPSRVMPAPAAARTP